MVTTQKGVQRMADQMVLLPPDYYRTLGVPRSATMSRIVAGWVDLVKGWHPGRSYDGDRDTYMQAMEAWRVLSDPDTREQYDSMTHAMWVETHKPRSYELDWLPQYIAYWVLDEVLGLPQAEAIGSLQGAWKDVVPAYIPHARLSAVFDVPRIVGRLLPLMEFSNFRALGDDPGAFEIEWRATKWESKGQIIGGTCKTIPEREAALWEGVGSAPKWRITLNLPLWLILDDFGREALVHHEMCHANIELGEADDEGIAPEPKVGTLPHTVEEFYETAARYGVQSAAHVGLMLAWLSHPNCRRQVQALGWDVEGLPEASKLHVHASPIVYLPALSPGDTLDQGRARAGAVSQAVSVENAVGMN
jgi:hypothetical protein